MLLQAFSESYTVAILKILRRISSCEYMQKNDFETLQSWQMQLLILWSDKNMLHLIVSSCHKLSAAQQKAHCDVS